MAIQNRTGKESEPNQQAAKHKIAQQESDTAQARRREQKPQPEDDPGNPPEARNPEIVETESINSAILH